MTTVQAERKQTEVLVQAMDRAMEYALAHTRQQTRQGRDIDDYQVHCERLAYRATELRAARELLNYAEV